MTSSQKLRHPAGAFVTVWRREGRKLRACVGRIDPRRPLIETVALAPEEAHEPQRSFVVEIMEGKR